MSILANTYAMNDVLKTRNAWEMGKKTAFADIDGWMALCTSKEENPQYNPAHLIYNARYKNVAFLAGDGALYIIGKEGNSHKTNRKFNVKTELKQAVRYAYFLLQKPKK